MASASSIFYRIIEDSGQVLYMRCEAHNCVHNMIRNIGAHILEMLAIYYYLNFLAKSLYFIKCYAFERLPSDVPCRYLLSYFFSVALDVFVYFVS